MPEEKILGGLALPCKVVPAWAKTQDSMSVQGFPKGRKIARIDLRTVEIIFGLWIDWEDFFDIRNQGNLQFKKFNSAVDICAVIG